MFLKNFSNIFAIIIIAIVYIVIFKALRIMNKDLKSGTKRKREKVRKVVGFEIVEPGNSYNLKKGGVIPIQGEITIGRRPGNTFVLDDQYISSRHVRVYIKNNEYVIEDLNSTNGTIINDVKIKGKKYLKNGDIVKIGKTILKFIA